MTTKNTSCYDLHAATNLAIAAGTASDYAQRACPGTDVHKALEKLSLRFAELALEALGGEAGMVTTDESAGA